MKSIWRWTTTLGRKVALKILPEAVASNLDRMQRFVQEAKAASALNHPNILTIHEIGTEPGAHFMATEFIDGRVQTQDFQWSADSRRLVYCANTAGPANIWQIAADGSGAMQLSDNSDANLLFFNPTWSPDGQRIAWLALSRPHSGQKKEGWSIWLAAEGKGQQIFQSDSLLGLIGWSQSEHELIVKSVAGKSSAPVPVDVSLFAIAITGGSARALGQLEATYFQTIQLAPAGNQIAFVTRLDGTDSLQVIPAAGGAAKTIITSNDPRVYFSGLVWSRNGKTIYYGKQQVGACFQ